MSRLPLDRTSLSDSVRTDRRRIEASELGAASRWPTATWRVTVHVLQQKDWTAQHRCVYQLEMASGDKDRARSFVALEKSTYDLPCRAELVSDFLVRHGDHVSFVKVT